MPIIIEGGKAVSSRTATITIQFKDGSQKIFDIQKTFSERKPDAYEVLILEALQGTKQWFVSINEIVASWNFISPIIEKFKTIPLHFYKKELSRNYNINSKNNNEYHNFMKIIFETESLMQKAGQALENMIKDTDGKPLLLLLSGGSAMSILDYVSEEVFNGQNITIGLLDDRYTQDPTASNFCILKTSTFYLKALRRDAVFLDTSVSEVETLEGYASRYETELKKWKKVNPDGIIRAVAGIGSDGHIAGILPFPESPEYLNNIMCGEKWIVGYDVGTKNPHQFRMTSTFTFIKMFNQTLVYASGEGKRQALTQVKAKEGSLAETPARIIRGLKNVTIYTDIKL